MLLPALSCRITGKEDLDAVSGASSDDLGFMTGDTGSSDSLLFWCEIFIAESVEEGEEAPYNCTADHGQMKSRDCNSPRCKGINTEVAQCMPNTARC